MTFSGETSHFVDVTFPAGRFTQPPVVNACTSSLPGGSIHLLVHCSNVTATSFRVSLYTADGAVTTTTGAVYVDWIAVQRTPGASAG
jgi:hypothetical protein